MGVQTPREDRASEIEFMTISYWESVEAMSRFVKRLWNVVNEVIERAPSGEPENGPLAKKAHATIAKVSDDIGRRFAFNTAIAAVMELVNELSKDRDGRDARFAAETAVSLVQPYAPHVAEELWSRLGHERLWEAPWPVAADGSGASIRRVVTRSFGSDPTNWLAATPTHDGIVTLSGPMTCIMAAMRAEGDLILIEVRPTRFVWRVP